MIDLNLYSRGSANLAPLFLYEETPKKQKKALIQKNALNITPEKPPLKNPNFTMEFWNTIQSQFSSVTPEEILGYIYAILHTPSYQKKYQDKLKIDFPRVPFNVEENFFKEMTELGSELIQAHLLVETPIKKIIGLSNFATKEKKYKIENFKYIEEEKRLYVNESLFFDQISCEVWKFHIGGYQVLNKYLKERMGKEIFEEIDHIENIIRSLTFTVEQMQKIDILYLSYFNK